jgi:hypothetical protein
VQQQKRVNELFKESAAPRPISCGASAIQAVVLASEHGWNSPNLELSTEVAENIVNGLDAPANKTVRQRTGLVKPGSGMLRCSAAKFRQSGYLEDIHGRFKPGESG